MMKLVSLLFFLTVLTIPHLSSSFTLAEEKPARDSSSLRKPVTCTDASGILYERGTPGFDRCLSEMIRPPSEQAGKVEEFPIQQSPRPAQ